MREIRYNVRIYRNDRLVFSTEVDGPVELGRQQTGETTYSLKYLPHDSRVARVVITPINDLNVSRRHVYLLPLENGRLRLTNLSATQSVRLSDRTTVPPGDSREIALPNRMLLGTQVIGLELPETTISMPPIEPVGKPSTAPGQSPVDTATIRQIAVSSGKAVDTEAVLRWLQATVLVAQSAATSKDFLQQVARAVVEIGFDSGAVLMKADGGWTTRAYYTEILTLGGLRWKPSDRVLKVVCEQKSTVWRMPDMGLASGTDSYHNLDAVVAAPVLDREGAVIGVVYGDRRAGSSRTGGISRVEALLVELLAGSVAAGLARLEQEHAALTARVRFAQFFSPELSQELEAHPDLLEGKDAEVSILVVDIRGFSRIAERLGPAKTVDWIRDTMSALSECVITHEGVLVDYVGDEILAMWGAPKDQPDHAARACQAALDMLAELPKLNERWQEALGEALDIGIGINTGLARVGNVGSDRKFKYGPLGNTVNLASRVQGASKFLKAQLVVSGATRAGLGEEFATRRLCRARVVNIGEPVELYEVLSAGNGNLEVLQRTYESALHEFEERRFDEAARLVGQILAAKADDGPSLVLMSRVLECLVAGPERFDVVWTLPGK
jgi:adenylate cyclase